MSTTTKHAQMVIVEPNGTFNVANPATLIQNITNCPGTAISSSGAPLYSFIGALRGAATWTASTSTSVSGTGSSTELANTAQSNKLGTTAKDTLDALINSDTMASTYSPLAGSSSLTKFGISGSEKTFGDMASADASKFVPTSRTINSKALTSDISLTLSNFGFSAATYRLYSTTNSFASGGTMSMVWNSKPTVATSNYATYFNSPQLAGKPWVTILKAGKYLVYGTLYATTSYTNSNYDILHVYLEHKNSSATSQVKVQTGQDLCVTSPYTNVTSPCLVVSASANDRIYVYATCECNNGNIGTEQSTLTLFRIGD